MVGVALALAESYILAGSFVATELLFVASSRLPN